MSDVNEELKIAILCEVDGQKTIGFAIRRDIPNAERVARASKMFGIFFLVAFFTIFIPILHFFLPPLVLLGGIVFATTTWLETSEVLRGEIACPNCNFLMKLPRESEEWPKVTRCGGCSYTLTLNR